MCGIGGITLTTPGLIKEEWMRTFLEQLEHRGPDDTGWLSLHGTALQQGKTHRADLVSEMVLLHRRLSIIDLSSAGHQPMGSQDGRYWIVFNGEIYNYVELRMDLHDRGYEFRSQSDTEVLLAAYQEWGKGVLTRLIGMFAFAILDIQSRRLLLARDYFGIKPLYYAFWQEGLAFSSEINPLLELPGVTRDVHAQHLYDYLRGGITSHGLETMFAHVNQLPAAHYMEVGLDNQREARPVQYWDIDRTEQADLSFQDAAKRLRDLFVESVRVHLRSDVSVGAALSGGIDSSAIVSVMRLIEPNLDIHTFSYVADDPKISEERWVDLVGSQKQVEIHKIRDTSKDLSPDLKALIETHDEPFRSTSMFAQRRVFQAAKQVGVKVMLDGQGADELLGGYGNYRVARIVSLLRHGCITEAARLFRCSSEFQDGGMWWITPRVLGALLPPWLRNPVRQLLTREVVPGWLNVSWFRERGVTWSTPNDDNANHTLKDSLYLTLTRTSLPQLLRSEDRNSMAFSIESRVPFLTPALAKFIFSLPENYIISANGTSKAVFRQAMRGIVPDAILDRRDKLGFVTPEQDWLTSSHSWVESTFASAAAEEIGALNVREVRQEWNDIIAGKANFRSHVWRWLNLILWAKKFGVNVL
jgi:asparagine synthase (glutamine-hydrolysing)